MSIKKVKKLSTVQRAIESLRDHIAETDDPVLPNEIELSKVLGISRLTLREAITVLEREGAVSRVQGKGTLVNSFVTKLENRIDTGSDIEGGLRRSGYEVRFEVPSFETRKATELESSKLNIELGEEILVIKKLLYANDMVAAVYVDRVPKKLVSKSELSAEEFKPTIFPIIEELCQMSITHDVLEMYPCSSDKEISEYFNIPIGTPLLGFDVLEYTKDSIALMYNTEYYTDKFVRFTLCRSIAYKS